MTEEERKTGAAARIDLAREADFALGPARVSPSAREIVIAGERQVLQPRVMQVLVALARRRGEVVSRDQLVMSCWGGLSVSEDAIQRSIAQLRRLAEQDGAQLFAIETIARVGYRLTEMVAGAAPPAEVMDFRAAAASPATIAVLPFLNLSSDPEQEYFSDGLSEELMNQLAQIKGLRVAARTSCFAFKGQAADVKLVGERLGVHHVLEGSVRRAGKRLRTSAQLISCADGYHLWSQTYDRELDDVFAIQEDIAKAVAEALSVTLGVGVMTRASGGTTDLEAYDKYLRARALVAQGTPADLIQAADMYREALAIDPDFALARGGLAITYAWSLIFIPESSEQTIRDLHETVEEALARAPDHWASYLANGVLQVLRRDWRAADAAFAKVQTLAQSSESSAAILSAYFLTGVGRSAEGVQVLQAARKADPLSMDVSQVLQMFLDIAGRASEAQAEYERTKDLARGNREIPEHETLLRIWESGDKARIKAQFRRFLDNQAIPIPVLSDVFEVYDQPAAALRLIRAAVEDPANKDTSRMMILAWYAAHFGDNELALAAFRRGFVDIRGFTVEAIWYPALSAARKTQGFKDLVRDLGLVDYWRSSGKWGDFARPLGADDFECW